VKWAAGRVIQHAVLARSVSYGETGFRLRSLTHFAVSLLVGVTYEVSDNVKFMIIFINKLHFAKDLCMIAVLLTQFLCGRCVPTAVQICP